MIAITSIVMTTVNLM